MTLGALFFAVALKSVCDAAPFLFSVTASLLFLATKAISVVTSFGKLSCVLPVYETKPGCPDPGPVSTSLRGGKGKQHPLSTAPSPSQ